MKAPDLTVAIAPHLPGWLAKSPEDGDWADLVRDDGATIRVRIGGWHRDGRVSFYGCGPSFADGTQYSMGKGERYAITCDVKRSAESLAKDVKRRLLPLYDHAYAKALAYVTKSDAAAREAQAVAERLAAALDARVGMNNLRRGDGVHIIGEPACVRRLVVQPAYNGIESRPVTVDFTVTDVDPETAAEVLAILKAAEDRRARGVDRLARVARQIVVEHFDELVVDHTGQTIASRRRLG